MADHPVYAAVYDRLLGPTEAALLGDRRARLLAEATGRVLEVGGGTGTNLAYLAHADSVTIVEPDGAMRRRLERRVAAMDGTLPGVEICPAAVEEAPLPPASFDTAVCTLVLCSVPAVGRALQAILRLLKPDGRLLFIEHVRGSGARARAQRLATPLWSRLVPGCHLDRDPLPVLREVGFVVTDCERFTMPLAGGLVHSAVLGVARPASAWAAA